MPETVTEEMLIALAQKNPEYRFETMADGRLVVSPLTGTFANFAEVELLRQLANWNVASKLGRVTGRAGGNTLTDGAIEGPDGAFISNERIASLATGKKELSSSSRRMPSSSSFRLRIVCRTSKRNALNTLRPEAALPYCLTDALAASRCIEGTVSPSSLKMRIPSRSVKRCPDSR